MNYEDRDTYGMYKTRGVTSPGPNTAQGPGPSLMGADTLVGNSVCNEHGEALGDIKEIMLDVHAGRVSYAVLSFGGFLGMGKKLFAVPWQALKLDTENKCFVLDVDKERLEAAPGFDPDHWPDMADQARVEEIDDYYRPSDRA
ncbi:MAG: PRC-barrel domain-containing protein [Pandoraea sp.]|nr:PRC-barrel domain-containing protein [Pandoraea sp.]MDR3397444.1 PRC-barrel domain-containing protein [Pandoraea sp.]